MMTEVNITLLEAMDEQVESVLALNLLAWDHQDIKIQSCLIPPIFTLYELH
jgi:hypothetical protein